MFIQSLVNRKVRWQRKKASYLASLAQAIERGQLENQKQTSIVKEMNIFGTF